MADAKWIDGLVPTMPLVEAARQALAVRLGAVCERLPQALNQADEDVEHVHQLRVSTRRAGAALRIFAVCLPGKDYKKMREPLRKLRRAAGEARDWDVFIEGLHKRRDKLQPAQQPGHDFLLGYGHGQRAATQRLLVDAMQKRPVELDQLVAKTLTALRPPEAPEAPTTLAGHAQPLLSILMEELNEAARQDLHQYEMLHQVRIAGKRLRYALEVFVCCFGPGFHEQLYPAVVEMQEILGRANDSYVAGCRLEAMRTLLKKRASKIWHRLQAGIDGLYKYHQRRLPKQRRAFLTWLKQWQALAASRPLEEMMRSETLNPDYSSK